jgi:hypothetical protein
VYCAITDGMPSQFLKLQKSWEILQEALMFGSKMSPQVAVAV